MNPHIQFFLGHALAHGRTLPLGEAIDYFRGLLLVAGDQKEVAKIRDTFVQLQECDRQLELIQTSQLKMPLK
jgi:hypothetical protein